MSQYVPIIIPIRLHYLINRGIGRTIWTISYSWVYMFHQITVEWLLQVLSPSIISIVVPVFFRIPFSQELPRTSSTSVVKISFKKSSSPLKSATNYNYYLANSTFYREQWQQHTTTHPWFPAAALLEATFLPRLDRLWGRLCWSRWSGAWDPLWMIQSIMSILIILKSISIIWKCVEYNLFNNKSSMSTIIWYIRFGFGLQLWLDFGRHQGLSSLKFHGCWWMLSINGLWSRNWMFQDWWTTSVNVAVWLCEVVPKKNVKQGNWDKTGWRSGGRLLCFCSML